MKKFRKVHLAVALIITLLVTLFPGLPAFATETNVAPLATVTVSSTYGGFNANAAVDGVVAGYPVDSSKEWASAMEGAGAWLQLTWSSPQTLTKIRLFDRPGSIDQVTSGTLTFSDGSSISVGALPDDASSAAEAVFAAKTVTWVKFTVGSVKAGTNSAGLSEIEAYAGSGGGSTNPPAASSNVAPQATVSVSSTYGGFQASAAVDGVVAGYPVDSSKEWASAMEGTGAWLQLTWGSPQTLTKIRLFDRPGSIDQVTSGTLTFSDGSSISVGALPDDASSPAEAVFAAKTVTWVRFTADSVKAGTNSAGLSEIEAYTGESSGNGGDNGGTPPTNPSTYPQYQISVVSPGYGSTINGTTTVKFYAPGFTIVYARAWHQPDAQHTDPQGYDNWFQGVVPDANGYAEITFPANDYPHGPMALQLSGWDSPPGSQSYNHSDDCYLQVFNNGGVVWNQGAPAAPAQAQGMSLLYQDDFTGALSISHSGAGATYASRKPNDSEFGEAAFADHEGPYDPFATVGSNYLRIRSTKAPAGFVDPMGWNRTHIGGLISSLRFDGTGVAATYGYFEARMLAPAGNGTWPAFWLLSKNTLTQGLPTEAELDIMEGYGHHPSGVCESVHSWGTVPELHTGDCQANSFGSGGDMAQTWHVYGTKVTPTDTIYYIDNVEVYRYPTTAQSKTPLYFMINLSLGGGWPIDLARYNDQVDLYVDYVRVYQ